MIAFFTILSIVAIIFYAGLSIYLRKPIGLFIAALMHIVLGIITLPTIGFIIFALAILEIIVGIWMIMKEKRHKR